MDAPSLPRWMKQKENEIKDNRWREKMGGGGGIGRLVKYSVT